MPLSLVLTYAHTIARQQAEADDVEIRLVQHYL